MMGRTGIQATMTPIETTVLMVPDRARAPPGPFSPSGTNRIPPPSRRYEKPVALHGERRRDGSYSSTRISGTGLRTLTGTSSG